MKSYRLGKLIPIVIGFAMIGSLALAQEPTQQGATDDHSAHHSDQQTAVDAAGEDTAGTGAENMMGGCPMMEGMMGGRMKGMKGRGMKSAEMMQQGMSGLFGTRVKPPMKLTVEDVRGYLDLQLDRVNNKRLKIGEVTEENEQTITADIVTVDDSLVQRLTVNRSTGVITYQ